eukprot:scaffold676_cov316-Pavlova_lutheri.AAC.4
MGSASNVRHAVRLRHLRHRRFARLGTSCWRMPANIRTGKRGYVFPVLDRRQKDPRLPASLPPGDRTFGRRGTNKLNRKLIEGRCPTRALR